MNHAERIRSGIASALAFAAALGLVLALGYAVARYTGSEVVYETESEFGRIRVVERADGLRSLYTGPGRARQSALYPDRPRHLALPYSRVAMVGLALVPPDARILFVGLGGGAMPMFARTVMPEAHVEVVEIDPAIVTVAQRFFGFRPDARLVVHTGDGRAFVERAPPGTYDLIVLDAFSDDAIPYALTTRQFLEAVRARLDPRGVVVSNLWSANPTYPSMLATYQRVFGTVHLVRVPDRAQRILVAGGGAERLDRAGLVEASRALADRVDLGFDLWPLIEEGYERPPARAGRVLEDPRRLRAAPRP